jgi:hypothetical protein
MKRFLQHLSESRHVLSEDMPTVDDGGRAPGFYHSTRPSTPEHLGNIGPYQVHHFEEHPSGEGEAITVHHEGKQVGVFPIYHQGRRSGRKIVSVDTPNLHPDHRGKKARVRGLASQVYAMIADKFGGVISGHSQTPGSQSLWRNLARMRKTTLVSDSKRKSMSNFGHSDHPKLKLSGDHMADYQFYHGSASESNPRSNSHQRKLNAMRNRLISGGVDKRKAGRMKKLADFPMPKSFKRTTTKIPSIKTYNPDNPEHESVAYHPDIGRDMRLLVLGKKKKK